MMSSEDKDRREGSKRSRKREGGDGGEKSKSKRRVHRGEKDTFQKKFPENYLTLQITTNYISN